MVELSLIGHLAYRYIGRKYPDISIYIDILIIFLKKGIKCNLNTPLLWFYDLFAYE